MSIQENNGRRSTPVETVVLTQQREMIPCHLSRQGGCGDAKEKRAKTEMAKSPLTTMHVVEKMGP